MVKLRKELTLLDAFCIATGAMISSGLFVLVGFAHNQAGPAVIISYVIAGFLALSGVFSQAELVSAMPKAGGTYFYVTRSLGPLVGTVQGIMTWLSLSLKSAFALVGMAAFIKDIIHLDIHLTSIALCVVFILINLIGIKEAGRLQIIFVLALIIILIIYIFKGVAHIEVLRFKPFLPYGRWAIFSTAGLVFVSYGGLLKLASVAEETRSAASNIPKAMFLSLGVVTILYFFVALVTVGVLPKDILDNSLTPISDGASVFMGKGGRIILGLAAIFAFISTANAGIMAASRYPLALSRDNLLPPLLGRLNKKFSTPHWAVILTGLFMIVALMFNLKILVETASAVLILTYIFSCLSVIIMRESRLQNYQPQFRSPLYPWVQIMGIIAFCFLFWEMGKEAILISVIVTLLSMLVYLFYGQRSASREYALLRLVERITAKEITQHILES